MATKLAQRNRIPTLCLVLLLLTAWGQPSIVIGQTTPVQQNSVQHHSAPIVVEGCRVHVVNELSLACERSGILEFVKSQGDHVKKGETIAQLRNSIAQAAYLIAERESANDIEIRFAKRASDLAQIKYEQSQNANQTLTGTVTDFELRELRLDAERSLMQLQQAEHQFEITQLKKQEQTELLKSYELVAPFDAFVRAAHKKPGEYVREGDTVLEIISDDVIRVDGHVDLALLSKIKPGNQVVVYLQQPNPHQENSKPIQFQGTVKFIDSKIEPLSMTASVSAEVRNFNSLLKDGLLVTMAIEPTPPTTATRNSGQPARQ